MGSINSFIPTAKSPRLTERELSKLHWRCRRGLLENDLFLARFFRLFESTLTQHHAQGLLSLMELADNDLLDLMLRRREPDAVLGTQPVVEVLGMLRQSSPDFALHLRSAPYQDTR